MYEFHGWFDLKPAVDEDGYEFTDVQAGVERMRPLVEALDGGPSVRVQVGPLNGQVFLSVDGVLNHRGGGGQDLDRLIAHVAADMPGSHGLLHERSDEGDVPPANAFSVRVMARGVLTRRTDTFLSPCNPTIED